MKHLAVIASLCLVSVVGAAQTRGGSQAGTEERNKQLIRQFYDEVWNKGNLDFADQVFAQDYVRHDPRGDKPPAPGPRGQKLIAAAFRKTVTDSQYIVDLIMAEGDLVAARWTIRGTHQPTGKKVEFVGVNIFRFANGKVVEVWNHRDDLAFQQQTATK